MTNFKLLSSLATLAAVSLLPSSALAFEYVEVGVGVLGHAGANFMDKPDEQTLNGLDVSPEYPGFAGLSLGVGPMIEVRFIKWVGLELDILYQRDRGEAELSFTNFSSKQTTKWSVEIAHDAWHLPLFVKGVVPGEIVQPTLFLGPEFVIPDPAETQITEGTPPAGVVSHEGISEDYIMFSFGLGMEIKLPIPLEHVSFRIPLSLRGSFNPGVSSSRAERGNFQVNNNDQLTVAQYLTTWKFQAAGSWGVAAHF